MRDAAGRKHLQGALLAWYDRHARAMPWRVGPAARAQGQRPDPYRIWLSEVMLQQTTVAAVKEPFTRFLAYWPDVGALAAAPDADVMAQWAGLGYYARARNLLACARAVVRDYGGQFPQTAAQLRALPGIGPYTSAAIAAIAHDEPAAVVDGNVERVMARMAKVETPLPDAKPELVALATAMTPDTRPGDYAQAVMDLGATICTPRNPVCSLCPWMEHCAAFAAGIAQDLPRKRPKPVKPVREGVAYLVRRSDGAWLVEHRPPQGLLGGMMIWPTEGWLTTEVSGPPVDAAFRPLTDEVRHTFTHFHLRLRVLQADVGLAETPLRGVFVPAAAFRLQGMPTVMRKVFALWRDQNAPLDDI